MSLAVAKTAQIVLSESDLQERDTVTSVANPWRKSIAWSFNHQVPYRKYIVQPDVKYINMSVVYPRMRSGRDEHVQVVR